MTTTANRTETEATAEAIQAAAETALRKGYGEIIEIAANNDATVGVCFQAAFDVLADDPQGLIASRLRRLADTLNAVADRIESL